MGKPRCCTAGVVFIGIGAALAAGFFAGCREKSSGATPPPSTPQATVPVASLWPAATNLIGGMGAEATLVAVSNYDPAGSRKLPAVGDYQTTDWETLAELRPSVMIIQMDPARLPAGFAQKATQIGIRLVNVHIDNLNDIFAAARHIGREIGAAPPGEALADTLPAIIEAVRRKGVAKPMVKTLLTLDERAETLVGPNTFLNDMLEAAGGQNAAAPLKVPYPQADVETLLALSPHTGIL